MGKIISIAARIYYNVGHGIHQRSPSVSIKINVLGKSENIVILARGNGTQCKTFCACRCDKVERGIGVARFVIIAVIDYKRSMPRVVVARFAQ